MQKNAIPYGAPQVLPSQPPFAAVLSADTMPVHVLPWDGAGLSAAQADLVSTAQHIVGGKAILAQIQNSAYVTQQDVHWHVLASPLKASLEYIAQAQAQGHRVVVMAHGDPLYFGIGSTLLEYFGAHGLCIHAGISILQRLCALVGQPWHDVRHVSLHGRNHMQQDAAWFSLYDALMQHKPVAILTDAQHKPAHIAQHLCQRGATHIHMHILEQWQAEKQRQSLQTLTLEDACHVQTDLPCTVLLVPYSCQQEGGFIQKARLGLDHTLLCKEQALFTKPAVRATALSLLGLEKSHILWDVGAGSGAVALEATALARRVIAIEQYAERVDHIQENRRRFGALNLDIVQGKAPQCFEELLLNGQPHGIFVGGGLGYKHATPLLDALCTALIAGGRLVMSAVLLGTMQAIQEYFQRKGWPVQCLQIQVNTAEPLGKEAHRDVRFVPQNPVFLLAVTKPY